MEENNVFEIKLKSESLKARGSPDDFDYSFALKRAPLDEDGYVKAFSSSQLEEAKQFFSEYGFMVIKNALSTEECEKTINDIWEYLELEKWKPKESNHTYGIKRTDPNTWFVPNGWPGGLQSEGILGNPPVFTRQAIENRMNKLLYEIGKFFYESEEIIITHDRYGLFRPLKIFEDKDQTNWMTECPYRYESMELF